MKIAGNFGTRVFFGMCGVVAGALAAGCASGKAGADVKLTAAEERAARKMVAAAEKAYAGVVEAEARRPRTLVSLDLEMEWSRNLANAQALVTPSAPERTWALQGHLDRLNKMEAAPAAGAVPGAGIPGDTDALEYARAQGEFALASEGATGAMTPAMERWAEAMAGAAERAYAVLLRTPENLLVTPEYVELRLAWLRRRARAEMLLMPTAVKRLPVLEANERRMREAAAWVERVRATAAPASRYQADYAVAEAEYLAEMNGGTGKTLTVEQREAAERMAASAEMARRGLEEIAAKGPRTPELLQVIMTYSRRVAEAGMALHGKGAERRRVVEDYLKRTQQTEAMANAWVNPSEANVYALMAGYAVAEAEYWVASER